MLVRPRTGLVRPRIKNSQTKDKASEVKDTASQTKVSFYYQAKVGLVRLRIGLSDYG